MVEVALRSIRHQCASLVSMGRSAVGDQVEHVPYLTYLIVFLCTAGLFGAYEGIKEAIFHGALSPWESHLATIFVAGLLSTAACEVLRKRSLELIAETSAAQARDFAFQQSFLQTLPLAVFYKDRNGRYLGCNHKFSEITGFSADMILGKTVYELWPGELAEMYHQKDLDLMARPEHQVYEFKIKDKDGVDLDVIYSKAVFCDERGVVAGIIGTFLDISDKVELINQMAATQVELQESAQALSVAKTAAETANAAKDAFLSNVSHELRTPLTAIIGLANLAQDLSIESKQRDYLDKILRSGKHMNRVVSDLLDLAKVAAGRMEFETIAFDIRGMIEMCTALMTPRALEKGLKLVAALADNVPPVLLGDPNRLQQVLLNLVGNAVKFTSTGRVELRVGLLEHDEGRACVKFEIEDSGIGMRPEEIERLFQPFAQADASISRKFGGTGLGLAISKQLVESMNGEIAVSSREGDGTTFVVKIWLGVGAIADLPPTDRPDQAPSTRYLGARVLVADDQSINREIAEVLLAKVGIASVLVKNGQEALDILTASGPGTFDAVLMDIQMPVMDGLTATRALRSRSEFASLAIIAMTANTLTDEMKVSADAGMNDHIGKPFDNTAFYRTLGRWMPGDKRVVGAVLPDGHAATTRRSNTNDGNLSIDGVDVAAALDRFRGNVGRYGYWLADFVETAPDIPDKFFAEYRSGNSEAAFKTLHSFRGRVGALGMTELLKIVVLLEIGLREGAPLEKLLADLTDAIEAMCNKIVQALDGDTVRLKDKACESV